MTIRAFCEPDALRPGTTLTLDDAESHYVVRVRRAGLGTHLEILDGEAMGFRGTVVTADPAACRVSVEAAIETTIPRRELELLLGIPEPNATLRIVTLACELGIARIDLVTCARSQGQCPSPARVRRVVRAAQRQCGRLKPPSITGPTVFAEAVARPSALPGFFAWERLRGEQGAVPSGEQAGARLLVGPEGGLTEDEVERCRALGFDELALGPWTLRTETAAIVGLTRLWWGC